MSENVKLFLIIFISFVVFAIFDTALSGLFRIYFTLMFVSFFMVKMKKMSDILLVIVFCGVLDDILFSWYIGPFTLTLFIVFGLYRIAKAYLPISDTISYFSICATAVFLLSVRTKFYNIIPAEISTLVFSIPVYYLLQTIFKQALKKEEIL